MREIIVRYNDGNDHMAVRGGEYVRDLVRCKDCRYDGTWKCPWRNTQVPRYPSAIDFCSYGEVRDE